ncbi:type II toxin-antitoxin system HicA family toxin [Mucilaginibacter gotjawali]|uniref:RNA binding protein YcfA (HicA-like mRNA interferase family) n=2 Tax=Mucilaginibacter gotjawali TaxID=1550579 RepID=A0A839SCQ9_9SPHI|nr:type II toxin-antitoxin system HicA family toxin [Mucilaginibacter gotjawali]MBB3055114.1 putative RNA binding protein YcfA (HicA-like mRNA interferase family) [Mucilaginibacter gotjawali]BAU56268.1 YcfA-like protein [Mucilaginibacter gotjawali]
MKTPRNLSAQELIKILAKYGYEITRQKGSHIRLVKQSEKGSHYVTIPNHNPIKLGTLSSIISDIADNLGINKEDFFN